MDSDDQSLSHLALNTFSNLFKIIIKKELFVEIVVASNEMHLRIMIHTDHSEKIPAKFTNNSIFPQ